MYKWKAKMVSLKVFTFIILFKLAPSYSATQLRVSTLYQEPFVTKGDNNAGFKGILIDLMIELCRRVNFTVGYRVATNPTFGRQNPDGTWSGIIGDVVGGTADIGLASLTVNSPRMKAVKFSIPFMTTGISAIGKGDVFSAIEDDADKILKMAQENQIVFGIMEGGATKIFFQTTENQLYKNIYKQIERNPRGFLQSYEEAIIAVRNSTDKPYVFFGERSLFDYYAGKPPCDMKVLTYYSFNVVHYGIAMSKTIANDFYENFNSALADMLSEGYVETLKRKYYVHNECKMFCMNLPVHSLEHV